MTLASGTPSVEFPEPATQFAARAADYAIAAPDRGTDADVREPDPQVRLIAVESSPAPQPVQGTPRGQAAESVWRRALILRCLTLGVVAVGCKIALLPFPVETAGQFLRWLLRLAIVVSPDVCFLAGLATACVVLDMLLCRVFRGRLTLPVTALRAVMTGFLASCAAYAVASVPMYKVTMVPFSIRLLSFAGGPGVMASSVEQHLSTLILVSLVAAPLAVLFVPYVLRRPLHFAGRRLPHIGRFRWIGIAALAAIAFYGLACRAYIRAEWTDPNRWERRIAQSPHGVLLSSCLEELLKAQPFTTQYSFAAVDTSDFVPPAAGIAEPAPPEAARRFVPHGPRPKNVLFVVLESVGAAYCSLNGAPYDTNPHLQRLRRQGGVLFENAYSQASSSCKSLVSLSACVYPRPDWLLIVRDNPGFRVPILPQVLKQHGYRTCYAHAGYWGWQNREPFFQARSVDTLIGADRRTGLDGSSWGMPDRTMYAELLSWIDQAPDQPFFAYAYTIETHHPYTAREPLADFGVDDAQFNRYLNALYAADEQVGWLVAELERRGLRDDTLIVITGDHGESFGQHNQRVHSFGIYEPAVRVPLLFLHPSLADVDPRQTQLAEHIDIGPTMLDMLDVPAPEVWQGRSLLSGTPAERAYFLSVGNEVVLGLREGPYKYHYYVDAEREELFDVEQDPREEHNLADREADRCAGYRRRVGGFVVHQRQFLAEQGVD